MTDSDSNHNDSSSPASKKRKIIDTDSVNNGDWQKNENCYFSSYADIELHRTMIEDQVRTDAYRNAIFAEKDWLKGKVIVDVGCGTGILSMFCAQAGAKKIYAIDASQIANHARELVKANGYEDIITVIKGKAEEVELPEKVDGIVSEWMGYMLLFESMLSSVIHIRDKYLKPGGKMFPEKAVIHLGLGEASWLRQHQENTYDFWISLMDTYHLDMASLADHAVDKYNNCSQVHMVAQEDIISPSSQIGSLDLLTVKAEDLVDVTSSFSLKSMGSRTLNCFVIWFDVSFPDKSILTTSPDNEATHWQNTVFPLEDVSVKQDTLVEGTVKILQNPTYYRHLNINFDYAIDDGKRIEKVYRMDDDYNDT